MIRASSGCSRNPHREILRDNPKTDICVEGVGSAGRSLARKIKSPRADTQALKGDPTPLVSEPPRRKRSVLSVVLSSRTYPDSTTTTGCTTPVALLTRGRRTKYPVTRDSHITHART